MRGLIITKCLLILVFSSNARPWYVDEDSCGMDAHPTSANNNHGFLGVDETITFKIQFTNPSASNEAQIGEDNPARTIPDAWDVGGNFYCKNCRMTITTKTYGWRYL
jgi:hypothetical protein